HWPTLATGVAIFVLLVVLKRASPRVPAPLIAVAGAIAAAVLLHLERHGVKFLGAIPSGLPAPMIPQIRSGDIEPLVLGAVGLTLISFSSAMVTARGFA